MQQNRNWLHKQFGEYFKAARLKSGLSQKDAADALGCHVQFVSNIERGTCNISFEFIRVLIKTYRLNESKVIQDVIDIQNKYIEAEIKDIRVQKRA